MATARLNAYVPLTLRIYKADGQYASECVELGTASCGDTVDEALANIREATQQYVSAIEAAGERDRVFKRKGIRIIIGDPEHDLLATPTARDQEIISPFALPISATHAEAAALL
jgi:predicted RNase H-like HicB family nuclease